MSEEEKPVDTSKIGAKYGLSAYESALVEEYLNGMKSYYTAENGFNIPKGFWENSRLREMVRLRRHRITDPMFPWHRCPWCKRVAKSGMGRYVFLHMYSRNNMGANRRDSGAGCSQMPGNLRELNLANKLINPFLDPKGEKKEFHFVEPEKISPVVAVRSERFSSGRWRHNRARRERAQGLESLQDIKPIDVVDLCEDVADSCEDVVDLCEDDYSDDDRDECEEYKKGLIKFFTEKKYFIPDGFWKDELVNEIIKSRIFMGLNSNFRWYRCPWCKKTEYAAYMKTVSDHMYGRSSFRSKKVCPSMPKEHEKLLMSKKLVDDLRKKEKNIPTFVEPEEMTPQMVLETELVYKKRTNFIPIDLSPSTKRQKTDKYEKNETVTRESENSDLPIDLSAGPSHRSQDLSYLLPSTSKRHSS